MTPARNKTRGFTLVEMLVVILVIAILVSIVVGVSSIVLRRTGVERTKMNMSVLSTAIKTYHDIKGSYPPEATAAEIGNPAGGWKPREWSAMKRARKLYNDLIADPEVQSRVSQLINNEGVKNVSVSPSYADNGPVFVDGFGKYMDYLETGGSGGQPLLLSAGPDGSFDRQEDNIRSDNR